MDNNWDGLESKDYHPGIEFLDEKGEKKMGLFSTGVHFGQEKQWANFSFLGLDLTDEKENRAILLTGGGFSYKTDKGLLFLFPHPNGLDLTLAGDGNTFGALIGHDRASMYVASPRGELDIVADQSGTNIRRTSK